MVDDAPRLRDNSAGRCASIVGHAKTAGYEVIAEYSDDGVKGADPVDQRPGFAAMMKHIAGNGVRTIIVETAIARDRRSAAAGAGDSVARRLFGARQRDHVGAVRL